MLVPSSRAHFHSIILKINYLRGCENIGVRFDLDALGQVCIEAWLSSGVGRPRVRGKQGVSSFFPGFSVFC
jgi:hypothetical protein